MKRIIESSCFDWIETACLPLPPAHAPNGVPFTCLIPSTFKCYAKVLHSFSVSEDRIDSSLTPEELAILHIPACISIKALVASKPWGTRIFWKEAAQALGVPYSQEITHGWFSRALAPNPQCWPRFIDGPADGALDAEECRELASILAKNTSESTCYFRLPEIPFIGTDQSLLFQGSLEEAPRFFADYQFGPEYWWPRDHQWCVSTDYDLTFSIVGGSSQLITDLLKSEVLECIEINSGIRVDDSAPMHRANQAPGFAAFSTNKVRSPV